MTERLLKRKPSASGKGNHITCWFRAWMHDDAPNLGSAFAAEIAHAADFRRSAWQRFVRPLPPSLCTLARSNRWLRSLAFANFLLITVCAAELYFPYTRALSVRILSLAAIVALVAGLKQIGGVASFAGALAKFVKDPNRAAAAASMNEVSKQLGQLITEATRNGGRFVIFIDDLERCRPPRAVEVLEVVNQLLDHKGVVTVVIGDIPAIAACAEMKYKALAQWYSPGGDSGKGSYGRSYLEKIIQLQFDMPAHSAEAIRALIEELSKRPATQPLQNRRSVFKTLVQIATAAIGVWYFVFRWGVERVRKEIDKLIDQQVIWSAADYVRVESTIGDRLRRSVPRTMLEDLLRERIQLRIGDDSELMRGAHSEIIQYVEPFPRHAKRLLNRLRLLVFIAHGRKMFGGRPPLEPKHIAKWAVMCERWPELAHEISNYPEIMFGMERTDTYDALVSQHASIYRDETVLRKFCLSPGTTKIGDLITRIVQFAPVGTGRTTLERELDYFGEKPRTEVKPRPARKSKSRRAELP
jgi:hypothetical protein